MSATRRILARLPVIALPVLLSCSSPAPPLAEDAPEILVFSRTTEYRHESIEPGIEALTDRAYDLGIRVEATEDPARFNEDDLSRYRAVVFLNTTGEVLGDRQQLAFERYIQAGGGFVGIHSAADTEWKGNLWPWYTRLVGAAFLSHPDPENVQQARLAVVDPSHPATSSLPDEWTHEDEFYDFHRPNPNVTTLLEVDESTYEGGRTGSPHAISWFHEFDGGRSFYTGLGHPTEAYESELFLNHVFGGLRWAMGDRLPTLSEADTRPEDWRIVPEVLAEDIGEPMGMAFTPGGELYVAERSGAVHRWDEETRALVPVVTLGAFTAVEHGLAGIVFDPGFETNGWVYLYWAHRADGERPVYRLARYRLQDGSLDLDSEKILLTVPVDHGPTSHEGGSMQFDSDGNLWLSTGDDTNPHESGGYAPLDGRPERTIYDSRRSAANSQDLRGKILRIRPTDDGSYEIPAGNLFADPTDGRPEIYAMGLRNPFRLSVDSETGTLYWGEIGPDADKDDPARGPRGFDEVNRTTRPGNFGWPFVIGPGVPYARYDWDRNEAGARFDPTAPANDSPRNTGLRELPPAQPAWLWYSYSEAGPFFDLESGSTATGRSAMVGPVFRRDDYAVTDETLPAYYDGKLFVYEFMRDWVKVVSMKDDGSIEKIEAFPTEIELVAPIDMKAAPDGTLYVLEYGSTWFKSNVDSRLTRFSYFAGDNPLPSARASVTPALGAAPLRIALDGSASFDRNPEDVLTYAWTLYRPDGSSTSVSREHTAEVTIEEPGEYDVELVVTDTGGGSSTASTRVIVGNEPPEIELRIGPNQSLFFEDQPIEYSAKVSDAEDGSTIDGGIDPASVRVSVEYEPDGSFARGPLYESRVAFGSLDPAIEAIDEYGCLSCHQPETESAGPSFEGVAQRYEGDLEKARPLARKIIEGGSGAWGDRAMPAQPHVTDEHAIAMANFVLRGTSGGGVGGRPLDGQVPLDRHEVEDTEVISGLIRGAYVVQASYTDQGAGEVGPITRQERRVLRPARMPVSSLDDIPANSRITIEPDRIPESIRGYTPEFPEDFEVIMGRNAEAISLDALDFTGVRQIDLWGVALSMFMSGGFVDLRLDAPDGRVVGTIEIPSTLLPELTIGSATIEPIDGRHDLYLSYRNDEEDREALLFMLLMIEFKRAS